MSLIERTKSDEVKAGLVAYWNIACRFVALAISMRLISSCTHFILTDCVFKIVHTDISAQSLSTLMLHIILRIPVSVCLPMGHHKLIHVRSIALYPCQ